MSMSGLVGEGGLLVHEWIEASGGAEKVLDAFHEIAPGADIFCLWNDAPERFPHTRVSESWLSRTPLRNRKAASMAVMSRAMRNAPTSALDWALVSSHSFAHHFAVESGRRRVPTFVYAHTPPRYLWAPEVDPRSASLAVRALGPLYRGIDRRQAGNGAHYVVNSHFVAERALRAWGFETPVIHPPVDVPHVRAQLAVPLQESEARLIDALPGTYVMGASRFVSYKRLDRVIDMAEELDVPAVICGSGPDESSLRQRAATAGVPVHILIRPPDPVLFQLFRNALVFIFPPIEDFGILPVEALAAGARIVVNAEGGAGEIVEMLGGGITHDFKPGAARETVDRAIVSPVPSSDLVEARLGKARFQDDVRGWLRRGGIDLTES